MNIKKLNNEKVILSYDISRDNKYNISDVKMEVIMNEYGVSIRYEFRDKDGKLVENYRDSYIID